MVSRSKRTPCSRHARSKCRRAAIGRIVFSARVNRARDEYCRGSAVDSRSLTRGSGARSQIWGFARVRYCALAVATDEQRTRERSRAGADWPALLRTPTCLASLQNLRADLERSGRYPWLSARTAYAVGQTLFRQGRIYEAAELLTIAQSGLRRTNDKAGEAMMDSLLANVLAMAGETDLALHHYLAGLRQPAPAIGDRRRRQLGDFEAFLLQHRFIATTELVLDELDRWPATDEGRVKAATLRGIIAARREDPSAASMYFRQAHARLAATLRGIIAARR